jgi:phage minor structural protein
MIVYFADRQLNVLGQASTGLPQGLRVTDDKKVEEVETGINTFECDVHFNKGTRAKVESYTEEGNYILRKHNGENELYTIIESELDTKKQVVYIYAEDAGLDLINDVVGAYEADKAYGISHYVNKYAANAGFVIGINEAKDLTRKLSWDGESTATERLASVATQFDGCEISYRYEIDRLSVVKRYIDIYRERGADTGVTLFLNRDIDNIITTKSIANLATALICTGGTPEDENLEDDKEPTAITLKGYKYDDGDFYVDGQVLKSRKAFKRWNRFLWKTDEAQQEGGHITKPYSYDTLSQATLCKHAITELKKICDTEINYEIDIKKLPDNVKIGDRVNIVDDAGEMYVSTRVLKLVSSVSDQEYTATLGEHLIKTSGIHQKVAELAAQFASTAQSAARALVISNNAKNAAKSAQGQANAALEGATNAQGAADAANAKADTALQSATEAQTAAGNAQAAVDIVEESVKELETTVDNAQQAADNAQAAAVTAQEKANEAKQSALTAIADAAIAKAATEATDEKANLALSKANEATNTASTAKSEAEAAQATAAAAKLDAETAQGEIDTLSENLTTLESTMTAEYSRKTELSEAKATLEAKITENAAEIEVIHGQVVTIDETANNAKELAEGAQETADTAKEQAEQATADALAAQSAADTAAQAAASAQSEADKAKQAAADAQSVADKAETDLAAAQADLATVTSRVDATEEEIAAAQQAVTTAQAAADKAKQEATNAQQAAATAQSTANTAKTDAANAQAAANDAASKANLAQQTADAAKGDATAAQQVADEAADAAAEAQRTANTAVNNATTAQATADAAAQAAADAQTAADDADAKAQQAANDLATAQQNLAAVTSRVGATEAEVQAAQQAVEIAQAAADKAKQDAAAAQSTADTAKTNAANAQQAADNAKDAADQAQADAEAAQAAAEAAQDAADALAVRVTTAETNITKNAEAIELRATKSEVTQTLGGYYTKSQAQADFKVVNDNITSTVKKIDEIRIGGRNLAKGTSEEYIEITVTNWSGQLSHTVNNVTNFKHQYTDYGVGVGDWLTFSVDLKAVNKPIAIRVDHQKTDGTASANYGNYVEAGNTGRSSVSVQVLEDYPIFNVYVGSNGTVAGNTIEQYKCLKIEKGNKATDWTPAPEDVAEDISGVEDTANDATARVSVAESSIEQLADSISTLITDSNGASLMKFENGRWTFSTAEIQGTVEQTAQGLSDLVNSVGDIDTAVDILQSAVDDLGVIAEYVKIGTYTYTDDEGIEQTEPSIDLGETDTGFRLKITNTRIAFTDGADTLVYIDSKNKSLNTEKVAVQEVQIGGSWVWKTRANGNLGLMWKGAE